MIILNGKKFAKTESEFVDSLFATGGTCVGYYRVNKRHVVLMDHNKVKVGVIVNNVLGEASKIDGKWWYSYGDIDLLGEYPYSTQCNEVHEITTRFNLPVKY